MKTPEKTPLERALEKFGSQAALAVVVGRTQQAVSEICRRGSAVPAEWVLPIENATNGEITRHELRPDIYPLEPERNGATS